ncbi:hypothetical protein [Mesorhizobium comanense]|uniref:hypothetical protein n=1 Tax=Mesorhizobium comanense TaxID=2502215 RepID=UPI0010F6DDD5|nr:hypothetical protein [Mesorhizobium comanense]
MRAQFILLGCTALFFISISASAATRDELINRYHVDPNAKKIGGEVLKVIRAHDADPVLKKYDLNNDAILEPSELKKAAADLNSKYSQPPWVKKLKPGEDTELFVQGAEAEQADTGIPIEAILEKDKPKPVTICGDDKQLFIRRDKLDNYMFDLAPVAKAQGASIGYLSDAQNDHSTFSVDGTVSYAWRKPCLSRPTGETVGRSYISAYAIAPWISAHGTRSSNGAKEQSDMRFGTEVQVELFDGPLFNTQYFDVSPYYQTDFRGEARAYGVEASWTPYWLEANLGGNSKRFSDIFDWYWQFAAEADYLNVQEVGRTALEADDYAWLGFTAKIQVFPFSDTDWAPDYIRDRIHATGTAKYYWDAISGRDIHDLIAEVAYNLDDTGATSLAVNYEKGTRKETLEDIDQVALKLNYKY